MPWKEATTMSERKAFIAKALEEGANFSAVCQEFGISRKTGYKWLKRYREEGLAGLQDQSRRPHHSPNRIPPEVEQVVVEARQAHPAWGGQKLKRWLENRGYQSVPAPSTVTNILARHGLLDPEESKKHTPYQRFEMDAPNDLWQMDFKGDFRISNGQRCYPLTVLDDHSRFLLGLRACSDETTKTVQEHVTTLFREFGLPVRMLMDNGSPWGFSAQQPYTRFTTWLLRLGIQVSHGRPYHPQTQGKDERLHRTLKLELLSSSSFDTLEECQRSFDRWRSLYNQERPHEALALDAPCTHYQPSSRPFPDILPPLEFPPGAIIRKVSLTGYVSFRGRRWPVGGAFAQYPVGLVYDDFDDTQLYVYFNNIRVRTIDLSA
jgi:transposase InsO family protein